MWSAANYQSIPPQNRHTAGGNLIQPKLKIGAPGDKYEQEADRVADAVMRKSDEQVQRQPVEEEEEAMQMQSMEEEEEVRMQPMDDEEELQMKCKECEEREKMQMKPAIQMKQGQAYASPDITDKINESRGQGRPLTPDLQREMSHKIGADFSKVHIHTDSTSVQMSKKLGAKAFTVGNNIYFNRGEYNPDSSSGKHLLAHELTHTVQQGAASSNSKKKPGTQNKLQQTGISRLTGGSSQQSIQRAEDLGATRFSGNRILERAFDGSALVSQSHNRRGAHVRLIQEALLALGYTLPNHNADGIFGPETETAVRAFQVDAGAEDLDGIVGSETMRLLDMQESGGTTSTGPGGPSPAAPTAAVFSESPNETFAGYDASTAPDWLVVPENERRRANVAVTPAGAIPTYVSDDPTVATVDTTDDGIMVTGVSHGTANIQARHGATVLATLRVSVKRQLDRSVAIHYVCDSRPAAAGGPHCSNGSPPAEEMRSLLNRVWHRQTNIRFTDGGSHNIVVPGDLGAEVEGFTTGAPEPEINAITARGAGADYNVYRVWEHHVDGSSPNGASNLGNDTILADAICGDGLGLPHECGHFLGLGHGSGFIMSPCGTRTDRRVSKAMADAVNP